MNYFAKVYNILVDYEFILMLMKFDEVKKIIRMFELKLYQKGM
jgi:hypothetical protein